MKPEELVKVWGRFAEKNDFKLNPDERFVKSICEGVLDNEKKYGLKLCPCRLRDGTRKRDLELICPCNFKTHESWKTEGRCWCGLFVKR